MIDESNLINYYWRGIYDNTKALTETKIIMKVLEKLNLVILNYNNLETQMIKNMKELEKEVNYYLSDGMKLEVSKKIDEMIENGTFNSIINEELLNEINNQVIINTEDIKDLKKLHHLTID